jgi:hypothetical protein
VAAEGGAAMRCGGVGGDWLAGGGGVMAGVEVTAHQRPGSDGSRQRCAGAWRVGVEEEGRLGRVGGPGRAGSGARGREPGAGPKEEEGRERGKKKGKKKRRNGKKKKGK